MRGATGITLRHHQILDLRHYKNGQRKNQTANVIDAAFPIGSIAADAKEWETGDGGVVRQILPGYSLIQICHGVFCCNNWVA